MKLNNKRKTLGVLAVLCVVAGFFWLVIHLELSNWDEPIPGQAVQPIHGAQTVGTAGNGGSASN